MSGNPKRRHVIKIEIQADNVREILGALKCIEFDLSYHEGQAKIVSGGYGSNYSVETEYYPYQTHEHYFQEIAAYLESLDKGGAA